MTITSIKSKQDYEQALKRVDELWNAELNTAEGDELSALVIIIETYEADLMNEGNLEYQNIFDVVTSNKEEALRLKSGANKLIKQRELYDATLPLTLFRRNLNSVFRKFESKQYKLILITKKRMPHLIVCRPNNKALG